MLFLCFDINCLLYCMFVDGREFSYFRCFNMCGYYGTFYGHHILNITLKRVFNFFILILRSHDYNLHVEGLLCLPICV